MGNNSIIKRGLAVLLLLIFFQQMGAGLFIHNLLHDKTSTGQFPYKKGDGAKEVSFACSCVDNFLTPFVETTEAIVSEMPVAWAKPVNSYIEQIHPVAILTAGQRGPPVFIV